MNSFGSYDPAIAVDFVRHWEGERLTAYQDSVGVWTIGVGHTGPDVHKGMKITKERSAELLANDLAATASRLAPFVNVPVSKNQYIALLSLSFNIGSLPRKAPSLMRKLNQKDYEGAAEEFLDINKAGGKVLRGLTRRRKAEHDLFLSEEDEA
jgi:lysozyme